MSRILTYTGKMFDVLAPDPASVDPVDIAHALSNLCRFTGHTRHFYSVAQHSVLVANLLPRELRFAGLMHDAHEAYIQDFATPLKNVLPGYREMEGPVWAAVAARFGLPEELPVEVKRADLVALAMEKRDLMPQHPEEWPALHGIIPLPGPVLPLAPELARWLWLDLFQSLGGTLQ